VAVVFVRCAAYNVVRSELGYSGGLSLQGGEANMETQQCVWLKSGVLCGIHSG
jgi:hypothetical protein